MKTTFRMAGARARAALACDSMASELWALLGAFRAFAPQGARWFVLRRDYQPVPVYSVRDLNRPLVTSAS
jgi:hypothetical protein